MKLTSQRTYKFPRVLVCGGSPLQVRCSFLQGDMDREFLEKNVIPYHQFFRADLPWPDKKYDFDLSQLKVS
jgi:hypothetical protein